MYAYGAKPVGEPLGGRDVRERHSHPIDRYVGYRVRVRRALLGMAQERLGTLLGLTFQQVQKYESGTNRISASRLFEIARALDVPVSYFYDEMPDAVVNAPLSGPRGKTADPGDAAEFPAMAQEEIFIRRETTELIRNYYRIINNSRRKAVLDLIRTCAESCDELT